MSGLLVSMRENASAVCSATVTAFLNCKQISEGNMHIVGTLNQRVGNYAHLTVGTVLSFERGVELVH